ncbi:AraC family transcriptional regulator [uncultured Holdemanella sp.]|uniref:helix-turn-helix domain-containing protein n=1 Tax=uncultured Holdemanella sp. TaxID=1763549 RepID=UPI0025D96FC3|nr:AraC family transcriptional regulator [uncultured Holdemanella sp.]
MSTQRFQIDQVNFNKARPKLLYIAESKFDHEWNSTLHTHLYTEMFYVTKGHGFLNLDNKAYPVKEDDLVIVNPLVSHTERGIENVNFEYIVMGIEGITLFSKEQDEEQGCSIANYYEYKHEVLFYLKTILLEVKARDMEYQSLCQNLLEVLLINLMRRANINLKTSPVHKANKDCVFIEKYIDAHFKEDVTLDKLSEVTFLNKYHIVHAFKQYKGISPINYMIQKRIEEAKLLLSTTNLQISEIACIVGFTSQSYFAQAFKKSTNNSPLQYRKDHSHQ